MIQLALARHAAAEAPDAATDDHDRPLSARGRKDAPDVAQRLLRTGVRPEVVLTSTALRARSTAEAFAAVWGAEVREDAELYDSLPQAILAAARGSGVDEVSVVAHDPGMSALVSALSGREVALPAGAVAVFTWESAGWDEVGTTPPDDVQLTTP